MPSQTKAARPHHRTTILTTSAREFSRVKSLRPGCITKLNVVNDIVSSAKGGQSIDHHMLRRSQLISRQLRGGYNKVKVRTDNSEVVSCRLLDMFASRNDECSFFVTVTKPETEKEG